MNEEQNALVAFEGTKSNEFASQKLSIFEGKKVRKTWFNNEWWFVVEDIAFAMTNSADPKQYINRLRERDEELSKGWVQIVHTLPVDTLGGKQNMNCTNTEGAFRIIQSIPSPKAEPFKLWLAKVGYERIQEIENPELAQERAKKYYEMKGYPQDWIDLRLKTIAVRQDLTDEWKNRQVTLEKDFAILTNEIHKGTFDISVQQHKEIKGIDTKSKQNLRDKMVNLELIFTMLGEASTKEIAKAKDAQGFNENKTVAKEGGKIAGDARKALEQKTKKKVVTEETPTRKLLK
jgi:hypothetical protein